MYYPRVWGWFARVLADRSAVDDLAQEVFARVCERLNRGETTAGSWNFIKGVARKVFLEHLRASRRRKSLVPLSGAAAVDPLPPPGEHHAEQEAREAILRLLIHLAEEDRCIVVGRHCLELTLRELADALGMATSSVIERDKRALCQLRKLALERGIRF